MNYFPIKKSISSFQFVCKICKFKNETLLFLWLFIFSTVNSYYLQNFYRFIQFSKFFWRPTLVNPEAYSTPTFAFFIFYSNSLLKNILRVSLTIIMSIILKNIMNGMIKVRIGFWRKIIFV